MLPRAAEETVEETQSSGEQLGADRGSVLATVYRAIDSVNRTLPAGERLEKSPETALMGSGGSLGSLGIVNLVVETEMAIEEDFGRAINLADQNGSAHGTRIYENVSSFAAYVETLLKRS